jgi:phosphoribosylformylglycinamidine cyclo-ligase
MSVTYEARGVSPHKPDVKAAIAQLDRGLFPGAFCSAIVDPFTNDPAWCLLSHADGAGTKSAVAYLHYRRHGDPTIFEGIAQDSLVMNIDDLLCVGAVGPYVMSNTIGRNAKKIPGEVITHLVTGYRKVAETLREHGIEITICGGETADVGDLVRTLIVDSTLTTRMKRADFIDASEVKPDQVILGLASDGQTTYEPGFNSGIGTNGFTMARHELLSAKYRDEAPETYAPEIHDLAYTGRCDIDDPVPGLPLTVGEALLSPTRTYAPLIKAILADGRQGISAIFHNTGGGQTKCLNFGTGIAYVKDNLFPEAEIFRFIRETTNLPYREMLRTFNMGFRMELVCNEDRAQEIEAKALKFGIGTRVIGHTEKAESNRLIIDTLAGPIEF